MEDIRGIDGDLDEWGELEPWTDLDEDVVFDTLEMVSNLEGGMLDPHGSWFII